MKRTPLAILLLVRTHGQAFHVLSEYSFPLPAFAVDPVLVRGVIKALVGWRAGVGVAGGVYRVDRGAGRGVAESVTVAGGQKEQEQGQEDMVQCGVGHGGDWRKWGACCLRGDQDVHSVGT